MEQLNRTMESFTVEFFGSGQWKTTPAVFLAEKNAVFLDIRTKEEIETIELRLQHHPIQTLHIPLHEIPARLDEIPRDRKVGLFCSSGVRVAMAYLYLRTAGYPDIVILTGGLDAIVSELKPPNVFKSMQQD